MVVLWSRQKSPPSADDKRGRSEEDWESRLLRDEA
jgi:hypothetical protein